jgi:hypothetical protein
MPVVHELTTDVFFAIVPEWLLDEPGVSDRAVRVYARLARYADKNGTAFPRRRTLADQCRCSIDSIDRAVKELEAVGALTVTRRRRGPGSASDTNLYVVRRTPPAQQQMRIDENGGRTAAASGGRGPAARK